MPPIDSPSTNGEKLKNHFISFRFFFVFLSIPLFFMGVHDLGRHYKQYPEAINLLEISGMLLILFTLYRTLIADLIPFLSERIGKERATSARYFIDFIFIASGVFIVLSLMGKGFENLALGGTVLSIVIGVAAQSSLTNFFSGFVLAFTQPFKVGDEISIVTWQYARLASTYSHETLAPEYRGTVVSLGMIYTHLRSDDGRSFMLPNSILLQAMLFEKNKDGDRITLRIDIPSSGNTEMIERKILDCLSGHYALSQKDISLHLLDFSASTVSYRVKFPAGDLVEQDVRDTLIRSVMPIVLPEKKGAGEALS
ncbi:MAG: mechanosensitive ion channel family protein [Nitrospiraceae bacterium]|jgi:small-conductance mechanosensitive channel|nr:mechanosensitive ion channel family protein [Nitrospiraceae bacterium]